MKIGACVVAVVAVVWVVVARLLLQHLELQVVLAEVVAPGAAAG